jgi:hypothetical protein
MLMILVSGGDLFVSRLGGPSLSYPRVGDRHRPTPIVAPVHVLRETTFRIRLHFVIWATPAPVRNDLLRQVERKHIASISDSRWMMKPRRCAVSC